MRFECKLLKTTTDSKLVEVQRTLLLVDVLLQALKARLLVALRVDIHKIPEADRLNFGKGLVITTLDYDLTKLNVSSLEKLPKSIRLFTISY